MRSGNQNISCVLTPRREPPVARDGVCSCCSEGRPWRGRDAILSGMTDEQKLISDWIGMLPVRAFDWEERLPKIYDSFNAR